MAKATPFDHNDTRLDLTADPRTRRTVAFLTASKRAARRSAVLASRDDARWN